MHLLGILVFVIVYLLGAEYQPFFRFLTHSLSRYSTCPLMERKSSSAQAAISFQRVGERRSTICFFALSFSFRLFSFVLTAFSFSFSSRSRALSFPAAAAAVLLSYCNLLPRRHPFDQCFVIALIQASAVNNRLCFLISAKHYQ